MDAVRRYLGIVWLILAALCAYFGIMYFGIPKITSPKPDDVVFGSIILFVLLPLIVGGLACFGYYAMKGEYAEE